MGTGLHGPYQSISTLDRLNGRVMIHCGVKDLLNVADLVDPLHSGFIVARSSSRTSRHTIGLLERVREQIFPAPVMIDAAAYKHTNATVESPFELANGLFGTGLDTALAEQVAAGAPGAITPTRRIPAHRFDLLNEVLARTEELQRDDTLCLLPLGISWFAGEDYKRLDHALHHTTTPVAISIIGSMDTLDAWPIRHQVRELLTQPHALSLLHSDLAAFEALSRGCRCASIGIRASMRPPHQRLLSRLPDTTSKPHRGSPTLLVADLLRWGSGDDLTHADGNATITCDCRACQGESLGRFDEPGADSARAAERHNIASWMPWAHEISTYPDLAAKQRWWRSKCYQAIELTAPAWARAHDVEIHDSPQLRFWSED